jgi:hypothetical protein
VNATPEVRADVRIIPAKRSASYDVPLESDRPKPRIVFAKVQASDVTISSNWPGTGSRDGLTRIPKTLEAINALAALIEAVRVELVEQGVES